jgi:hypothetical protein
VQLIILSIIYFSAILTSITAAILQWRSVSKADKFIITLLLITLLNELLAIGAMKILRNDMLLYHVYSPIELLIICLYFNEKIQSLKRFHIGIGIGVLGFIIASINIIFVQPYNTINSIFLVYEGFCVIALSLYSFYRLALEETELTRSSQFWFTTILLIYWSTVFIYWGMFPILLTSLQGFMSGITTGMRIINIVTYIGFALVFLNYKKLSISE